LNQPPLAMIDMSFIWWSLCRKTKARKDVRACIHSSMDDQYLMSRATAYCFQNDYMTRSSKVRVSIFPIMPVNPEIKRSSAWNSSLQTTSRS